MSHEAANKKAAYTRLLEWRSEWVKVYRILFHWERRKHLTACELRKAGVLEGNKGVGE